MIELHGRQKHTNEIRRLSLLDAYSLSDQRRTSVFQTQIQEGRSLLGSSSTEGSGYPSTANSARISSTSVILETDETETEQTDLETDTDEDSGIIHKSYNTG